MKTQYRNNKKWYFLILLTTIAVLLGACTSTAAEVVVPTVNIDEITENVASTLASQITQDAAAAAMAEAAAPTATALPTATAMPTEAPTEEPEPTEEAAPTEVPTATAVPTATTVVSSSSSSASCIYVASFNADVTVPDGTEYAAGTAFTKTWKITNIGTCSWDTDFKIVFYSGDQMNGPSSTSFHTGTVKPGATTTISLDLKAPAEDGEYTGYWILQTDMGETFGLGSAGKPLSLTIVVD